MKKRKKKRTLAHALDALTVNRVLVLVNVLSQELMESLAKGLSWTVKHDIFIDWHAFLRIGRQNFLIHLANSIRVQQHRRVVSSATVTTAAAQCNFVIFLCLHCSG